jgi:sarcosine oxidase subunit beta
MYTHYRVVVISGGVVDLYDASTDWIPIYDKTSISAYYMACGTSGNQY